MQNRAQKINRLVIGGPENGNLIHWQGDVVELPGGVTYRKKKLMIDDVSAYIYIHDELTDEEALEMLKENYLGV